VTFERGFKARANRISLEIREELNLEPHAPLCPWKLADHLGIPVKTLKDLSVAAPEIAGHVDYLSHRGSKTFSAITVFDGSRRSILHNHGHALTRQRSDIAHEIAHALLMHPAHPPFCANGQRVYRRELENEAAWLGPVLLVPNEAAQWAVAAGLSDDVAAQGFGVSKDLMRFRYRMSGAQKIAGRLRQKDT
jgi:Zn-dependent peptidase ImmA (M78 family)